MSCLDGSQKQCFPLESFHNTEISMLGVAEWEILNFVLGQKNMSIFGRIWKDISICCRILKSPETTHDKEKLFIWVREAIHFVEFIQRTEISMFCILEVQILNFVPKQINTSIFGRFWKDMSIFGRFF